MTELAPDIPRETTGRDRWLTPGTGGIGAASLLADVGHEVPTSLLPSRLTSTLGAPASALGLSEGVSDGLAGAAKLGGGALADDPHRRRQIAIGGYSATVTSAASARERERLVVLTRGEDYAFAQPSLTTKKMRRLELQAGAPRNQGGRGVWSTNTAMRNAERELALQAQRAYEQTIKDRQAKNGASATTGRARSGPSKGQVARQTR